MKEYRRDVEHKPDNEYHWVILGPLPEVPPWHLQSEPTRYPFPTDTAAFRFAENNKATYPGRSVEVLTIDGERFVI